MLPPAGCAIVIQVVSGGVQVAGLLLLVAELVANARISPWYAEILRLPHDPGAIPSVADPRRLAGLVGAGGGVAWRWEPERRVLVFRRQLGFVRGHRGVATGAVRFGPDGRPVLTWHPVPLTLFPMLMLFAAAGLVFLAVTEGDVGAIVAIPVAVIFLAAIAAVQAFVSRLTLRRLLIPRLAEAVADHIAG